MTDPVPAVTDVLSVVETPAAPAPVVPDRADHPVTEVSERFLRAVVASVPLEQIEELHLFSPLRQGTVETGIAVLAARVPVVVIEPVADASVARGEPELALEHSAARDTDAGETRAGETPDGETPDGETPHGESPDGETPDDLVVVDTADVEIANDDAHGHVDADSEVDTEGVRVTAAAGDDDDDVAIVDAVTMEPADARTGAATDVPADEADEADEADVADVADEADAIVDVPPPAVRPVRHTVYTARYRYVIKGPERGKWESNVTAEAEAPLMTVETVVRGVQRRAGEDSEIVRYSAAQIARALRLPFPG